MRSLLALAVGAAAVSAEGVNPIRKIVTLLQDMKKEIEAEGEKNQELYEKFMCFCKKNKGSLGDSAAAAQAQIDELTAKVKADSAEKAQLKADLNQHKEDRTNAKKDLATAEKLREKEHAEFVAAAGDTKANLDAVSKAIPALEQGMGATGFLQTTAGAHLKSTITNLADSLISSDSDREAMVAFLEESKDYAPQSGQIVGILKNMKDEMDKALGGINADEEAAVASFNDLKAAKQKEIAAASSAIESKTERAGKLAVSVVQAKAEAENASDELADSQKFAAELEQNCATKTEEHNQMQKTRAEEVMAIGEAINVLNDDDALDIFNKTLKKPEQKATGFLQVRNRHANKLTKARAMLASMKIEKNPALALLQSTVVAQIKSGEQAGKVDFSKVLKMIDDMVKLLGQEQKDDLESRDWCNSEFDKSGDEKKDTEAKVAGLESTIAEVKDSIASLAQEIAATKDKIAALDQSVAEAGQQREQEHAEYEASLQLNQAAVALIFKAKNRLQKFYNPALHVKAQRRELTREEQILVNNGGADPRDAEEAEMIPGTQIPVFVQIKAHSFSSSEVDPPSMPETGSYKKSGGKGNSVMALMDMLTKEVETDMSESKHAEQTAQKEYETLVADAQETKAQDTKTVITSEASKADMEAQLDEAKNGHSLASDQLSQVKTYIQELHGSCDFILANFDARKEARTNEVEGLKNAKAVLSGADYSF